MQILDSPIIAFILLLIITQLIYLRFFTDKMPSVTSGCILMAFAAFSLDSLQQLGFPYFLLIYVALEILIIGLYLGLCLIQGILEDEINIRELAEDLSIGTWIVGISLTVFLLNQVDRTLIGFVALLSVVAFSLFAYYLLVMARWFYSYVRKGTKLQVTGKVLMPALSVQAMALLISELFHDGIPAIIYGIIVGFGMTLFVLGVVCLLHYIYVSRSRHILASWLNENTLFYGALSLTGVAMINCLVFPDWAIYTLWYSTFILFIIIEFVDVLRLVNRFKYKTYDKAIGVYHQSQWLRIFSFSVFYTFSISAYEYEYSDDLIISAIANYGQYVVAVLMIIEIILLFKYLTHKESAK